MLIDSHCHLDRLELTPYGGNLDGAIEHAHQRGVELMLCVSINMENFPAVRAIAERYAEVYASVGVHPNETEGHDPTIDELVSLAAHPKVIAIGETGLDYFRSEGDLEWQRDRFRRHISAAKLSGKPLIIHSREARADTLRILEEERAGEVGGIMHCFVEDRATAERAMALGFLISFSGIVTFRNAAALQEVAQHIPADRLLVETDAPYLAPIPHRGKPNEPAYVRDVAEFIAQLRGVSLEMVAQQTSSNFRRLFQL
ncbi:MAG TPA: TatD family hydrolase [Gammaproteobacteria bacterium]